jgi:hypothetical protein
MNRTETAYQVSSLNIDVSAYSMNKDDMKKIDNIIIIIDWDDTLIASSYLQSNSLMDLSFSELDEAHQKALKECEDNVRSILLFSKQLTEHVYIVTNASDKWVENSINKFYPNLLKEEILKDVKIIYAKNYYCPAMLWKYYAIKNILNNVIGEGKNKKQKTNYFDKKFEDNENNSDTDTDDSDTDNFDFIECNSVPNVSKPKILDAKKLNYVISIGDSNYERVAMQCIRQKYDDVLTEIIKMILSPNCEQIKMQLNLVSNCIRYVLSDDKHFDVMTCFEHKENDVCNITIKHNSEKLDNDVKWIFFNEYKEWNGEANNTDHKIDSTKQNENEFTLTNNTETEEKTLQKPLEANALVSKNTYNHNDFTETCIWENFIELNGLSVFFYEEH